MEELVEIQEQEEVIGHEMLCITLVINAIKISAQHAFMSLKKLLSSRRPSTMRTQMNSKQLNEYIAN